MRRRYIRSSTWAAAWLFVAATGLLANPLTEPRRALSGQTVDLTPLFRWWTNHAGTRPLTAWVHVTGSIVGTNGWGWVVEGRAEEGPHGGETKGAGKLLLRNPPLQERAEFERLSAQLKELEAERAQVAGVESKAQTQEKTLAKERNLYRKEGSRAGALAQESRQLKRTENAAKTELKPLDQQIQVLKKKLAPYPNPEHYEVDCLALETGQALGQLPVYDHGVGFK